MDNTKQAWFKTVGYKPHPSQRLFHNSKARFRCPLCGRRFGKSVMSARDKEPTLLKPNTRGWICGPTYDLGEKEFRVFWDDLIVGQQWGKDPNVRKAYSVKQGNMYIELPNRARVEVRSSDHPETLVGEGLDWLIMSEAAKHQEGIWEKYLRPALSDKHGTADFPTTPEGQNWLYSGPYQLGQGRNPDYESWNFPSWFNTVVFPGGRDDPEIKAAEATTSKEYFDQEYGAIPTSFVGKIFEAFTDELNVRPVNFNPAWPSYIAFDWGFTNYFAAIEFQVGSVDGMEMVFVWREYYDVGKTIGQHIHAMHERENPTGHHLDLGFGDAADPQAALEMSLNFVPTMALPEAKENWREGIDLMASFIQETETGDTVDAYGTPKRTTRFFADPSCRQFIHEMVNYSKAKPPKTGTDAQDKPKKRSDHGVDAMRYALMHLFKLGARLNVQDLAKANPHLLVAQPGIVISPYEAVGALTGTGALLESVGSGGTIFNFGDSSDTDF